MKRQIMLDTETTGLEHSKGHRIIEVACVEMINRRLTRNTFYKRIHPEREIDEGATNIHGISIEDLEYEPKFAAIADALIDYVAGAEVIIHNAPFDVGFLNAEFARLNKPKFETLCTVVDTLGMAREQHPGKKNSLDALCDRYEIDRSARTFHGALMDAELLAEVYIALTRGQDSLSIGVDGGGDAGASRASVAARPAHLKVVRANAAEEAAHTQIVAGLNKASGDKAVWNSYTVAKPDA